MKNMKSFFNLGSIVITFSPLIVLISCGSNSNSIPKPIIENSKNYNLNSIKEKAISIINELSNDDVNIKTYKNIKDEFLKLFSQPTKWFAQIRPFIYHWDSNSPNFPHTIDDFILYCQQKIDNNVVVNNPNTSWTIIKSKINNLGGPIAGSNLFLHSLDVFTNEELEIILANANNPFNLMGNSLNQYKESIKAINTRTELNNKFVGILSSSNKIIDPSLNNYWVAYDLFIRQLAPSSMISKENMINRISQILNVSNTSEQITQAVAQLNHLFTNYNLTTININDFYNK